MNKILPFIGGLCFLLGLTLNEYLLALLFSGDGVLLFSTRVMIWAFDVILVGLGLLFIYFPTAVANSFKAATAKRSRVFPSTYFLALITISAVKFWIHGNHTAFEWTTTMDMPAIVRLINPDFLLNDFFTNSVLESPRFIFWYLIYGLTYFGFSWYSILYFLKVAYTVCLPAVLFLMMYQVFKTWRPKNFSHSNREITKIILFINTVVLMQFQYATSLGPFGFGSIQNITFISPLTLSFIFGLLYNYLSLLTNKIRFFAPLLLILCTLIHPVIGLCHFVITFIFSAPLFCRWNDLSTHGTDFIIGIIAPILLLLIKYNNPLPLKADTFINYYVYIRHPHHYLMSSVIGWPTIKCLLISGIPIIFSIYTRNKRLIVLSVLIFLSFILAPILQFLGTEVWKIKKIAELGPSRYTAFYTLNLSLNCIIVFSLYLNQLKVSLPRFMMFANCCIMWISSVVSYFNKISQKIHLSLVYIILLTIGIYAFTYQNPLDQDKSKKQLVEWINKYTNVDAIFLCEENVDISFLVRIYGNRAVFADIAFPFNESFAKEFTERFLIYNQTINYNPSDYYSLTKKYPIDYLIIHENKKHKFEEYLPVFISKPYLVYKIDQFMTDSSSKGHRKQTL